MVLLQHRRRNNSLERPPEVSQKLKESNPFDGRQIFAEVTVGRHYTENHENSATDCRLADGRTSPGESGFLPQNVQFGHELQDTHFVKRSTAIFAKHSE